MTRSLPSALITLTSARSVGLHFRKVKLRASRREPCSRITRAAWKALTMAECWCGTTVHSRGLCEKHYRKALRNGESLPAHLKRPRGMTSHDAFLYHHPADPRGPECSLWEHTKQHAGHGEFKLRGKTYRAHVVSYEIYVGEIPPGMWVLHDPVLCNTPACVNPNHLRVGTPAENSCDQLLSGTRRRGESHAQARLSEADVHEIRHRHADGVNQRMLAQEYGIDQSHVSRIISSKVWAHV